MWEDEVLAPGRIAKTKKMIHVRSTPDQYMDVSENSGTTKSSISIGFSSINHPIWGIPIFGNTHINCLITELLQEGEIELHAKKIRIFRLTSKKE